MNTEKTGICIFAYTRQGIQTARKAAACLKQENRRITTDTDSEEQLDWIHLYTTEKLLERVQEEQPAMLQGLHLIQQPTVEFYGRCFRQSEALIFIGATGIAVRNIVPHIRDKQTDPAVLCMDELGTFVIPILSGHIGGANQLASEIAQKVGAVPVITTATDIHQKFSVDSWASRNQMIIDDIRIAKQISSTILEQEIPICSDFPVVTDYPAGTFPWIRKPHVLRDSARDCTGTDDCAGLEDSAVSEDRIAMDDHAGPDDHVAMGDEGSGTHAAMDDHAEPDDHAAMGDEEPDTHAARNDDAEPDDCTAVADDIKPSDHTEMVDDTGSGDCATMHDDTVPGILISVRKDRPFAETLRLIPRILHLGIGCRKGVFAEMIEQAVRMVFQKQNLDLRAVEGVYSIDRKGDEPGLLAFCNQHHLPLHIYSAEELRNVPGDFTASSFVEQTIGVDNVCERAALKDASCLLVRKTSLDGVTVAIAQEDLEIRF